MSHPTGLHEAARFPNRYRSPKVAVELDPRTSLASLESPRLLLMARQQNRKRQRADHSSQDNHPVKRRKSTTEPRRASNFSPAFWDHLSKVWLTPRALRELDRRNSTQRPPTTPTAPDVASTDLARFARHGGPDLRHLRGVRASLCRFVIAN